MNESEKLAKKSAAVHHRKLDAKKAEKLQCGDSAIAFKGGPNEVIGFVEEILPDDRVTVSNWNESVTIPARKVTIQD